MNRDDFFEEDMPNRIIPGFPYAKRFCPYCERELQILKALHIMDQEEHYKAILICDSPLCDAHDEEARKAYLRVYYSSEFAYKALETVMITKDPR